jgi:hypothetical protein
VPVGVALTPTTPLGGSAGASFSSRSYRRVR